MRVTCAPSVLQAEVARLLVQSGARVDPQNRAERTPLQLAPPGLARDLRQLASSADL